MERCQTASARVPRSRWGFGYFFQPKLTVSGSAEVAEIPAPNALHGLPRARLRNLRAPSPSTLCLFIFFSLSDVFFMDQVHVGQSCERVVDFFQQHLLEPRFVSLTD